MCEVTNEEFWKATKRHAMWSATEAELECHIQRLRQSNHHSNQIVVFAAHTVLEMRYKARQRCG